MGPFLRRKPKNTLQPSDHDNTASYNNSEFQKNELYKRGVSQMANDKLEDAIRNFELALRVDQNYVDAWIKKGYAHFHLEQYQASIQSYDRALEIDLTNPEAWNLKGLTYYKMKNYEKAIEACEKAIDFDPTDAMSWYNEACFLILSGRVDDGLEALKRSIEIDITYAKKAVSDRDLQNARNEDGFRRIIEVVVLESIRQGHDHVGKIVWTTSMDKEEIQDAMNRLLTKGLVVRKERTYPFRGKEEYYELTKEIAEKVGYTKKVGFLRKNQQMLAPIEQLHDISMILSKARESIEKGDIGQTMESFEQLINPAIHGNIIVEQFFEEHRDLRLFLIRLRDKGQDYLNSHKTNLLDLINRMDIKVRNGAVSKNAEDL